MRASRSAGCGIVLGMVTATGCAPFFDGEPVPASPERPVTAGIYRGPARVASAEGIYNAAPPAEEIPPAAAEPRPPIVVTLPPAESCAEPVVITIACGGGNAVTRDPLADLDAPPAPYKPWPSEGRPAPRLYHDR
jgi:hypothetical protein